MMQGYQTKGLTVGYAKKVVAEGIEISVEPGRILTLIGPNGSGKSTVLKTLISELKKIEGTIYLDGRDMEHIKASELAKELAIVMTSRPQSEYMTVYDVLSMGRYPYTGRFGLLTDEDRKIISELLVETELEAVKDTLFDCLSDGQKQRVMIARALCQNPRVLILDEPTSYLDIHYKTEILYLLKERVKQDGLALILSLHELDFAARISDSLLCLKGGKVDYYGSAERILTDDYISRLFDVDAGKQRALRSYLPDKENRQPHARHKKAGVLMVQGTMSNAGKSLLCAGFCRVFKQDGYRVCPFKSQNMALNSYITEDGLEMGRAQVMQAEACGITPSADMNPILLKPTTDVGSQVIVNGKSIGNMSAADYFSYKKQLLPDILKAYERLEEAFDIIVVEGAGSPAEINLKENDIVNMGLAELLDAPVLLVGDIDRGGVFAQLLGTIELLDENERDRIEGLIINKFRGDRAILDPGIDSLEQMTGKPVLGTVPYINVSIDDEDSLSSRLSERKEGLIDIAVILFPRISNFTDLHALELQPDVGVRYVSRPEELKNPDMIILPGSKSTIADLKWLKESGLEIMLLKKAAENCPILGICGGYQMLCRSVSDPSNAEGGGYAEGLGLLDGDTVMQEEKITRQVSLGLGRVEGIFHELSGCRVTGYEIHMGITENSVDGELPLHCRENIYGTYIHGFFDEGPIAHIVIAALAKKKGISIGGGETDYRAAKEIEYDRLADTIRSSFDMKQIYEIMEKYYGKADKEGTV